MRRGVPRRDQDLLDTSRDPSREGSQDLEGENGRLRGRLLDTEAQGILRREFEPQGQRVFGGGIQDLRNTGWIRLDEGVRTLRG